MPHPPPKKRPGQEGNWVVAKALGQDANSIVTLWHLVDSTGNFIDRMISKQIIAHHTRDVIPHNNQIREVFISQVLAPSGTRPTEMVTVPITEIIRLEGTSNSWVAYMPYFPLESLTQFITKQDTRIPEPFAWYMFSRLAKACVLMDDSLNSPSEHFKIVLVDLKPENIFMGTPGSLGKGAPFPAYPPIYVGDFGSAQITYDGDDTSKRRFIGWSTTGWAGPELAGYNIDGDTPPPETWQQPPSSYTNIWQVGNTMLRCLQRQVNPGEEIDWGSKAFEQWAPSYLGDEPSTERLGHYSNDLLYLIDICLRFRAKLRPSPQELLEKIEEKMHNYTDGMEEWGTETWLAEKEATIISLNFKAEHKIGSMFGLKEETKRRFYTEKFPEFAAVQRSWRRIVAKQIKEGKRVMLWDRDVPLSPLDVGRRQGVLSKGAELLLCQESNMLYHPVIDECFDVDTYWDRKDPEPVVYKVEPEYAKAWAEERKAQAAASER